MRPRLQLLATIYLLCAATVVVSAGAAPLKLTYRGKVKLSDAENTVKDQNGKSFTIAGLSGVTYLGNDTYIAVMDNSNHLVALAVKFDKEGKIIDHKVLGGDTIPESRDYEGIAYTNPKRNSVFISDEAPARASPKVYEYSLAKSGKLLQVINLPPIFTLQVPNKGLESLTRRADGQEMWTANEEALSADGPESTDKAGTVVRLQRFEVKDDTVTLAQEYAYVTEPIHSGVGKPFCSGLSDMVVLPDGTLITLERSAMEGLPPFDTRIFQVDLVGATDISRGELANGLIGQKYTPVKKTQLFDSKEAGNSIGENLEGLCLGPQLSDGRWALLGVCDNGDPVSKNTLVAFELTSPSSQKSALVPTLTGALIAILFAVRQLNLIRRPSPRDQKQAQGLQPLG